MDIVFTTEDANAPRWTDLNGVNGPQQDGEATIRPTGSKRHSRPANAVSKGCVLVVDDDQSVRETLADLLELEGYRPLQASDALEALMILRQESAIDALVTDLTMPGADGLMLIRYAREIRPELPAILLTGYAEEVTSIAMIGGRSFHLLRKPVESQRLIEQLELLVTRFQHA